MPTKTASPATELERLVNEKEKHYASLQEIKRARNEHDRAITDLQAELTTFIAEHPEDWRDEARNPKDGSPSAKLRDKVRERMQAPNPHEEEFNARRETFLEADARLQTFRIEGMGALLGERKPEVDAARDKMREGFALIAEGAELYADEVDYVIELVRHCPALGGQATAFDPRPANWLNQAREVLEAEEVTAPGITEYGEWRLQNRAG